MTCLMTQAFPLVRSIPQRWSPALPLLLLALLPLLSGCNIVAVVAHVASGPRTVQISAQYKDLSGHRVAVMVLADDQTLYRFPQAPAAASRSVSRNLAEHLPELQLMHPEDVIRFQHHTPYWNTLPYTALIRTLEVDRLILIELVDYRTHEPGNAAVWQGVISATVAVVEAESPDPDDLAFRTTVSARYPDGTRIGITDSDDATIQTAMLQIFAQNAARLFYDHQITR